MVELVGGVALGVGVMGVVGAVLLALARRTGWSAPGFRPLAIFALALFAYSAAWCSPAPTASSPPSWAGWPSVPSTPHNDEEMLEFTEEAGTLLSLLVWFIFGAVMLVPGFDHVGWRDVVFAVLALTVLRMGPVALSLKGSGLDRMTVLFMGWFGPRGLASVVFGLLAADALAPEQADCVLGAVTLTVTLSILLHGISASPLAARYGAYAARLGPETTRALRRQAHRDPHRSSGGPVVSPHHPARRARALTPSRPGGYPEGRYEGPHQAHCNRIATGIGGRAADIGPMGVGGDRRGRA